MLSESTSTTLAALSLAPGIMLRSWEQMDLTRSASKTTLKTESYTTWRFNALWLKFSGYHETCKTVFVLKVSLACLGNMAAAGRATK